MVRVIRAAPGGAGCSSCEYDAAVSHRSVDIEEVAGREFLESNSDSSDSDEEDDDGDWDSMDWWALMDDDAIEFAAGREFDNLKRAHEKARAKVPAADTFDGKRQCLLELEELWASVTPKSFVRSVVSLGEDAHKYLNKLSFRMKAEEWEEHHHRTSRSVSGTYKSLHREKQPCGHSVHTYKLQHALENVAREPGGKIFVKCVYWNQHDLREPISIRRETQVKKFIEPWETQAKKDRGKSWQWLRFILQENKTEYVVHWSCAAHLIHPEDLRSQIHITRALADAGPHSNVFNTAVGRAIQTVAWQQCRVAFVFSLFLDCSYILLLFLIAGVVRFGYEPNQTLTTLAFVFSLFRVGLLIIEVFSTLKVYRSHALAKLCNKMFAITVILEGLSSWMMISVFLTSKPGAPCEDATCYLWKHPVYFAFTIFGKWLALIWSLFCMPYFGEHALPAVYAALHTESVTYVCFLSLVVIASWHTYWSFPIQENMEGQHSEAASSMHLEGIDWKGFMKIFNLELLGDFSLWDLEGQDPILNATIINGTVVGDIGNRTIHSRWHYGLQMLFVIWSTMVTIVLMNVAIGITSNLFNMHKAHKHQIHLHFKANYTYRVLLWHYFFVHCVPWALRCCDVCGEHGSAAQREQRLRLRRKLVQHKRERRRREAAYKESLLDGIWRNEEGEEFAISSYDILRAPSLTADASSDEGEEKVTALIGDEPAKYDRHIMLGDEPAKLWPEKTGKPARLESEGSIWERQAEGSWIVFDPRTFMDEPGSDQHALLKIDVKLRELAKSVNDLISLQESPASNGEHGAEVDRPARPTPRASGGTTLPRRGSEPSRQSRGAYSAVLT